MSETSPTTLGRRLTDMAHHTAVYSLGPVLRHVTGFLLLPLYASLLSPADYGTLELLMLVGTVLNVFLGLQTATQIMRLYHAARSDRERGQAVSTGIIFTALLTAAAIVLADVFRHAISTALFDTAASAPLVRLALWTLVANNVLTTGLAYFQARRMSRSFTLLSIAHFVATVSLNLVFVAALGWGVEGILLSQLAVTGVLAVGVAGWVLARTGLGVSARNVREMVAFGLPLIGWSLAVFTMNAADRVVLAAVGSLSDVGVYSLAARFAAVLFLFVVTPFSTFWSAERFAVAKQHGGPAIIGRVFTYFVAALCLLGLAISIWIGEAIRLMAAEQFWAAASIGPVLVLASILWGMFDFMMTGVLIAGRTRTVGVLTAIAAVAHVALCVVLGGAFLVAGIAWAKVITLAALAVGVYLVAQRRYAIRYQLGRLARVLGVTVGLFFASTLLDGFPPLVAIALKAPLLVAFPFALAAVGFLDRVERRWIAERGAAFVAARRARRQGPLAVHSARARRS